MISSLSIAGGVLLFLFLQMLFWNIVARRASKRAGFLSRVWGPEVDNAPAVALKATRLAQKKSLQKILAGQPLAHALAELLEQSGLDLTVARLTGQMAGAAVVALLGTLALQLSPVVVIISALVCLFLPLVYVLSKRGERAAAFEKQLPQALELMSLLLRSGRALPQAIESMGTELTPPASEEFATISEEYRLGRPLASAMKNVCKKYPRSTGFLSFTVALSVLGQTGGNLVHIIEKIRKTIEMESHYAMRLRSLTGEARTSAWILGSLPPLFSFVSALTNPEMFQVLLSTDVGRMILAAVFLLWVGGAWWLRSLMTSRPI